MSRKVLVISNDVVPGQAMPVAAPGLRAFGLASGLRQHGFDVSVVTMDGPVDAQWESDIPPPVPEDTIVLQGPDLMSYIRSRSPVSVIYTNSNQVNYLEPVNGVRYVMDFFAPKVLELVSSGSEYPADELGKLRTRKIKALELADAIVVNGRKKIPYVLGWILQTSNDANSLPIELAEMAVPGRFEDPPSDGPLTVSIAGYAQKWSAPGSWIEVLHEPLENGDLRALMVVPPHWGQSSDVSTSDAMIRLSELPGVTRHGALPFAQFRSAIAPTHVSLDMFDYSLEREYAMVTRTVVALSTGLPVIHPPFTEVSPLIEEYDAGWIVDPEDEQGLEGLLMDLIGHPEEAIRKRENARRLWAKHFDPKVATSALAEILDRDGSA